MSRHLTVLLVVCAVVRGQESRPSAFDAAAFRPIFDGTTLSGFTTRGGRYDGNAAWTVEDGAICGREGRDHAGGLLYTERRYASFVLSLDVWMTRPNDSGIFVRMAPEGRGAQITLDDRDDGEIGAVYADEFLAHNTTARARWRPQTWHRVEVRCTGRDLRVEAWLDGEKISDHQVAKGTSGFARSGLIGFQVHGARNDPPGTVVKFRDIRILELPTFDTADFAVDARGVMAPTEAGFRRGFRPLDPGDPKAWDTTKSGLVSVEDFEDFELQLDYRLTVRGGNSGLFLRAARGAENPAFSGCEIQILDDHDWESVHGKRLLPWQFSGSIYGSSAPRVGGAAAPVGAWNTLRVVYVGSRLSVDLNNVVVQDHDVTTLAHPAGEKPFAERARRGFVGIQKYGDDPLPDLRNVFVRRIER